MEQIEIRNRIGNLTWQQVRDLSNYEPSFFYEREKITGRINALRRSFPDGLKLAYSLKANPFAHLVDLVLQQLEGADVTSYSEMVAALNAGVRPADIMFAGPAKKPMELRAAVALGVGLCVESLRELSLLTEIAREQGKPARVLLRLNPEFSLSGASMRMGGAPTQFGLNTEDLPEVWRLLASPHLAFCGIHIYWGSQCLSESAIFEAQETSVDLIESLAPHFPNPPEILNLGGGFGIPYFAKDTALDLTLVGRSFAPLYERLKNRFPEAGVFLELGRYLVGEAGTYLCNVVDTKTSHGVEFVVTDGGMHHFLAASGNLGQKIRRNYPVCLIPSPDRAGNGEPRIYQVVGALCTPIDLLGHRLTGPDVRVGDMIGIGCAGAYGKSASPLDFLSHRHPHEFII